MDDWRMEEVENQVRFREFNEWIGSSNDLMGPRRPMEEFICECSDPDCREPISLTRLEYESIRARGDQFLIALDHENPELDRVLRQNDRYAVSEELPGAGRRRVCSTDPRIRDQRSALRPPAGRYSVEVPPEHSPLHVALAVLEHLVREYGAEVTDVELEEKGASGSIQICLPVDRAASAQSAD